MVLGIDSFREKFKDYTDYYTIIGGTACDILLTEADLPFRATKDIDMILIMEDNFLQIVTTGTKVESEGLVTESIHRYIEEISAVDESEVRLQQMGMPFDRDKGVELLKEIYF